MCSVRDFAQGGGVRASKASEVQSAPSLAGGCCIHSIPALVADITGFVEFLKLAVKSHFVFGLWQHPMHNAADKQWNNAIFSGK